MPYLPFSQKHIVELQRYDWPGNIRELQNVLERALITAKHGAVSFQYLLEQEPSQTIQHNQAVAIEQVLSIQQLKQLETENLQLAIKLCEGKIFGDEGAAKLLGINPTTLISKLKKLGIKY